ncbi:MAG TPA: hypothetical protein VF221_06470, partial [Chloroflexota bacterium]
TALSGHLTYFYWKPAHVSAGALLLINVPASTLAGQCTRTRRVGTIHNSLGIANEEQGTPIILCEGSYIDLDRVWPAQQHFD